MTRILQILPRVPPAVCGIGDYAWLLAQALRDTHDIHSSFLSAGTDWTKPEGDTEFPVFRLPELNAQALVTFVEAHKHEFQAVVLHMSPYGYQKRGVPLWLASGWQQLSQMQGRPRLITMFHELYASGSMRSSAYWLQPLQKWVLRAVAQASDALRTNREVSVDWLRKVTRRPAGEIASMPVFSNLGEISGACISEQRLCSMAMFAYQAGEDINYWSELNNVVSALRVKHVINLGKRVLPPYGACRWDIEQRGFLSASDMSEMLKGVRLGYMRYNPAFLGKSGILAAFAAHGVIPVLSSWDGPLSEGIVNKVHVIRAREIEEGFDDAMIDRLSANIRQWYESHSVAATAADYCRQIQQRE